MDTHFDNPKDQELFQEVCQTCGWDDELIKEHILNAAELEMAFIEYCRHALSIWRTSEEHGILM